MPVGIVAVTVAAGRRSIVPDAHLMPSGSAVQPMLAQSLVRCCQAQASRPETAIAGGETDARGEALRRLGAARSGDPANASQATRTKLDQWRGMGKLLSGGSKAQRGRHGRAGVRMM